VTNTCGTATATYPISVTAAREAPTTLAYADNADISVYPNPSTGIVSIDLSQLQGQVTILISDINGRTLTSVDVLENEKKPMFDLSNNAKGIYLIKVSNNGNEYTRKVVIE
jgi:hypothetical protein